jgi:hypothetical protein
VIREAEGSAGPGRPARRSTSTSSRISATTRSPRGTGTPRRHVPPTRHTGPTSTPMGIARG